MNYSWFNQQRENGQKLIQNSLEWKLRNVVRKNDLSQTPEILSFMNKKNKFINLTYLHNKPRNISKKVKSEFGNSSGL